MTTLEVLPSSVVDLSPTEGSLTAASRVYRIPSLRREILGYLPDSSLARFMGLEKDLLRDVASHLYSDVDVCIFWHLLKMRSPRSSLYLGAVLRLEVEYPDYARTTIPYLRWHAPLELQQAIASSKSAADDDVDYHKDLVLITRFHWSNLRRISIQDRDLWDFRLTVGMEGGELDFHGEIIGRQDPLMVGIEPPSSTFLDSYTVRYSFDLYLNELDDDKPELLDLWATAIKSDQRFCRIGELLDAGMVPLTIGDLGSLCVRQRPETPRRRLRHIEAPRTHPFELEDFRRFATVTSENLGTLILAGNYHDHSTPSSLTFNDLPSLISIISETLPHLCCLMLSINGWSSAEPICESYLEPNMGRGNIRHLVLFGPNRALQHFNLIRYLARICNDGALLELGHASRITGRAVDDIMTEGSESEREFGITWESRFLAWLRAQPLQSQRHLATIDFASLDVAHLKDALELRYDEEGKPIPRGQSKAHAWTQSGEGIQAMTDNLCHNISASVNSFETTLSDFRKATNADDKTAILTAAKNLDQSLSKVRSIQQSLSQLVDSGMDQDLAKYINALELLRDE